MLNFKNVSSLTVINFRYNILKDKKLVDSSIKGDEKKLLVFAIYFSVLINLDKVYFPFYF
jgi:hypothetical protein